MLSFRHTYSWHLEAWSGSCRTALLQMGRLRWPDTRVCAMLYHSLQGFHLVWTSQALGWGCCNPCPYRMHSSHWQLLSVKTGSVPSHSLQKALPSPPSGIWECCAAVVKDQRSLWLPPTPGHCSGRSPLSTALILNCAAGSPCLFNFPLLALPTLGPPLHPVLQPCRRAPVYGSAMCERKAIKEHCPSNYNTGFSISSPFSTGLFFCRFKEIVWFVSNEVFTLQLICFNLHMFPSCFT